MGLLCEWSWVETKTEECILQRRHRDKYVAVYAVTVYKFTMNIPPRSGCFTLCPGHSVTDSRDHHPRSNQSRVKVTMKFTLPIISLLASTAMAAIGDLCVAQNVRRTVLDMNPFAPRRPIPFFAGKKQVAK